MNTRHIFLFLGFLGLTLSATPGKALGEQPSIAIPFQSESDSQPIIDGVWTTPDEWRKASEMILNYTDGTQLVIRGKHDSSSLFILLEMPRDYVLDGHAAICFDTSSDRGPYMKEDDHCFVLGNNILKEYIGDGKTTLMRQTALSPNVIARSGLSDEISQHEAGKSHVSYEFKLPLSFLGDNSRFGFYVTFDTHGQSTNYTYYYSWPDYDSAASLRVASPRDWGTLEISSETVVPEFPLHVIGVIVTAIGTVTVFTRTRLFKSYRI